MIGPIFKKDSMERSLGLKLPPSMPLRITIKEFARVANCSISTISNAMNGTGRMSPARRNEIRRLASQIGFQPNIAGRNLRLQRTDTIGLLFNPSPSELFKNIFYVEVMEGLEETLYEKDYNLLLGSGRKELAQGQIPKFVLKGGVDLLVLVGPFDDSQLEVLQQSPCPIFLLDSSHDEFPIDSLTTDGHGGLMQAVGYLTELGHRQIAFLAYDLPNYNINLRIKGFQAAARRFGLSDQQAVLIHNFQTNDELFPILQRCLFADQRPTAIICVNDTQAVFVNNALKKLGLNVPRDISLIGFDDDFVVSQQEPPLTTVRIERKGLGSEGAKMILKRLKTPDLPIQKAFQPVTLVVRESTAPPSLDFTKRHQ